MNTQHKKIVNEELSELYNVLSLLEFLNVEWQCDCHCGLVISHVPANTTLWLRYDEDKEKYVLNSSIPEESFAGQKNQFMCMIEIHNLITEYNVLFPENAINNIELDIAPLAI